MGGFFCIFFEINGVVVIIVGVVGVDFLGDWFEEICFVVLVVDGFDCLVMDFFVWFDGEFVFFVGGLLF